MSAQIVDRTLRVAVGGFSYSVAECGEQLAWLAVALQRLSPRRLCVPYLVGKDFNLVGKPPGGTHPIHIRLGDYVALDSNVLLPPSSLGSEPSATLEKTSEGRVSDGTNVPASGTSFDWIPSNGSRGTAHSTVTTTISTEHEESLDSDMLSISDRSDRFNPFGQEPAVSVIFSEIFHRLLDDWRLTRCCQSSSEQSSQSSSSAPQTGSTSTQVQSQESRTQGNQKRRQQDLDCSDDGFDGDSGSSRPRKKPKNGMVPRKCFACPFWKKNPRAHRDCFGYKLSRIKDVKQHLARQHTPIHCERCLQVFQDRHSKTEHFKSYEPCVRGLHGDLDGVTNEQSDDLRKKSKRGQTEPEQWYAIWAILFSSSKQPDSPYMDFEQSQEFAEWEEFCQRRASIVLVEQLSRQIWGGSDSPAWLPDLLRIVQDGFRAAFDEFRSQDGSSVLSSEAYDDVDGTRLGELGAVCPGQSGRQGGQEPAETHIPLPLQAPNHSMGLVDRIGEQSNEAGQDWGELQNLGQWLNWDANLD